MKQHMNLTWCSLYICWIHTNFRIIYISPILKAMKRNVSILPRKVVAVLLCGHINEGLLIKLQQDGIIFPSSTTNLEWALFSYTRAIKILVDPLKTISGCKGVKSMPSVFCKSNRCICSYLVWFIEIILRLSHIVWYYCVPCTTTYVNWCILHIPQLVDQPFLLVFFHFSHVQRQKFALNCSQLWLC